MSKLKIATLLAAALTLNAVALATVTFHQGSTEIGSLLGDATFDTMATYDPLQNYMEDGLTLDVDDFAFVFTPPGFDPAWGPPYYPNGGAYDDVVITRTDGGDFEVLEMNISHGFGGTDIYAWARAYLDGGMEAEFDLDVQGGELIGFTGVFDELRISSYSDAATRDLHIPDSFQAIALDNVAFGYIPEPASLALLGMGVLLLSRRR
jgi:hypothetical protein